MNLKGWLQVGKAKILGSFQPPRQLRFTTQLPPLGTPNRYGWEFKKNMMS